MMNEYLAWVKENGKIELRYWLYWKVWAMILITAFVMFVYNVCHNLVYYIAGDYGVYGGSENQLVDLGFKAFDWAADLWFWPNFCLYLLAALSLAFLASISFTRKIITNPDVHIAQAAWRACLVACVVVPLRCISFLITIIPAPADHCSKDGGFSPPADVAEIFTRFDIGYGCSDLIFSGHQAYGMLATLVVHHYTIMGLRGYEPTKRERRLKYSFVVFCWGIALFEAFGIVRQQAHYSIDVFTSLYVVPAIWVVMYHFCPTDPEPPKSLGALKEVASVNDESSGGSLGPTV